MCVKEDLTIQVGYAFPRLYVRWLNLLQGYQNHQFEDQSDHDESHKVDNLVVFVNILRFRDLDKVLLAHIEDDYYLYDWKSKDRPDNQLVQDIARHSLIIIIMS